MKQSTVAPAQGKLGILVVGCGAVSTTFMTGVLMARKGLAKPVGSMTQYDKMRVGRGADAKYLHYADIVPLAKLDDIVFGCWDVYPQNAYQAAMYAEVLKEKDINPVREELEQIVPMPAAFDKNYAKRLDGDNVKASLTRWEMVEALRKDICDFKAQKGCERVVVLWAASTEIYVPINEQVHYQLADLENAMKADDREHIAPSMCYAYAALSEGAPFIMGAPNTTVDIPAMWQLAEKTKMPIAGKDFKTGQTLVKSGFAPIIGTRCLGLSGWFSTNILGNRDGLVLDEDTPAEKKLSAENVGEILIFNAVEVPRNSPVPKDFDKTFYQSVGADYVVHCEVLALGATKVEDKTIGLVSSVIGGGLSLSGSGSGNRDKTLRRVGTSVGLLGLVGMTDITKRTALDTVVNMQFISVATGEVVWEEHFTGQAIKHHKPDKNYDDVWTQAYMESVEDAAKQISKRVNKYVDRVIVKGKSDKNFVPKVSVGKLGGGKLF